MVQKIEMIGLHATTKVVKNKTYTYYYAWRGGPPMVDPNTGKKPEPYSPEFLTLFKKLTEPPETVPVFADIIAKYKASSDFAGLADNTKATYTRAIDNEIEPAFGGMEVEFLNVPAVRGKFKDWRDEFAEAGMKAKADQMWSVLQRLCSFAVDRGMVATNPCLNPGRLYKSDRSGFVWSEDDLKKLYAVASPEVYAVVIMALWTGQRKSDCLKMKWSDLMAGGKIKVRQDKRGAKIAIPVGSALGAVLARLPRTEDNHILTSSLGTKWTIDGFNTSYGRAYALARITGGLHFHDLRGTAITRMALVGCTAIEIASVTGHSIKTVQDIMDNHYLGGRDKLAFNAVAKLEKSLAEFA